MGYSAGGHLALLYAYTASAPIPVKMVISIAGPADLTSILDAAPDILQEALPKLTALTGGYDPSDPDFVSRLRAISPRYTYDPKYQQMKTVLVYSSDDQYVNFSDNAVELMSVLYGYAAASELHGLLHEYIPAYVTGVQEGIDSWATPLGCPWPT